MIFVTGGTGLIGSHLLFDLVQKGEKVRALKRKKSNTEEVKKIFSYYSENAAELFSKIEWVEGDLLDIFSLEEAMNDISHVYHCGAFVSLNPQFKKKIIGENIRGTANIVNVALEKKIKKFCHVSSVASLGFEKNGKEISEETQWNGKADFSSYAVSKFYSENEVWRASQEGLNMIIANPAVVIGPGNWYRSNGVIFKQANAGFRWYSGGGIAYVDVRDVTKAMIALMESEIKNERFIICAENLPYKNFLTLVNSSLKKPLPNKKAGKFALALAWRADKLKSIFTGSSHALTREVARYSLLKLSYSNKKIKNKLGINFIPVSQSISETAKHFLSDFSARRK